MLKTLRERKKKGKCLVIKEMGNGGGKLLINALPAGSFDGRS